MDLQNIMDNRLLNHAQFMGWSLDQYQKQLDENAEIKKEIQVELNDIRRIEEESLEQIAVCKFTIELIQKRCTHIDNTYYADPCGGRDSHTQCNTCGKIY